MYLFHFGGTLLRPLYSETRASTIVPECEICKCNSAVGNLWASFHVAQQINAAVKKNDACSSSIDTVISNLFVLHAESRAARSGTTRIILDKVTSKRALGLLVGISKRRKKGTPCSGGGKIISSHHVSPPS
jgi:hypothetical protein